MKALHLALPLLATLLAPPAVAVEINDWLKLDGFGTGGAFEVKRQLANNPYLIGFIEKTALDGSVKVVFSP